MLFSRQAIQSLVKPVAFFLKPSLVKGRVFLHCEHFLDSLAISIIYFFILGPAQLVLVLVVGPGGPAANPTKVHTGQVVRLTLAFILTLAMNANP